MRITGHPLPRPRLLPATIAAMSALLVLKSVLLVQAAAEEVGGAHAAESAPSVAPIAGVIPPAGKPSAQAAASAPAPGASPVAPPPLQVSESERAVLLALRGRRQVLEARARALDEREAELTAADHRLEDRVQQLAALQTRLEGMENDRKTHRAENWAGLVKTYEAMKPREAAAIFDVLDMQVLLQVMDRMAERRAAPVLAAMQPDRARLVTQLLAEMRTRSTAPPDSVAPASPKG